MPVMPAKVRHQHNGHAAPLMSVAERLAAVGWEEACNARFATAAREGDLAGFVRAWRRGPAKQLRPHGEMRRLLPEMSTVTLAGGEGDARSELLREALAGADETVDAIDAVNNCANAVSALADALESSERLGLPQTSMLLTLITSLPRAVDAEVFVRLWLAAVELVAAHAVDGAAAMFADPVDGVLLGEVLFRGGLLLTGVAGAAAWTKTGSRTLREALVRAVDDEGFPVLAEPHRVGELVAAFMRSTADGAAVEAKLWKRKEERRLRRLVTRLAALHLFDGPPAFVDRGGAVGGLKPLLDRLGRLAGLDKRAGARRLLKELAANDDNERHRRPIHAKPSAYDADDSPAGESDGAKLAILRNSWRADSAACLLGFDDTHPQLLLSPHGQSCIAGGWEMQVELNGEPVALTQPWRCECWYSDADGDFIELSRELPGGGTVIRQLALLRSDRACVLLDGVRGVPDTVELKWRSRLPFAAGVRAEEDGYTRELQLVHANRRVRVFPVSLPWERVTRSSGSVRATRIGLELQWSGAGAGVLPVVLTWTDDDGTAPAEWSPLTIAEAGRSLPAKDAVAGRLRVGKQQWLYLHNLTSGPIPRSVLGHHTPSETVIATVSREGEVTPVLHVAGE
ncbi:MAG: hypothetical protein R3B90_12240 [Planctomycetaceae bacterium]